MMWTCKHFDTLTPHELYAILQLRNAVFVVEQTCIFQDADDKDQYCYHLMAWNDDILAAYTRLVPSGVSYREISIGRVVTHSQFRKQNLGRELMHRSIEEIWKIWGRQDIRISAQVYLRNFYESFSFTGTGEIYLEDDIEHIEMLLKA